MKILSITIIFTATLICATVLLMSDRSPAACGILLAGLIPTLSLIGTKP
jgi:hypothetical protein